MKKIILLFVVIVLVVGAYKYYKYYEHNLVVGNPIFNDNIDDSKKNKTFVFSYLTPDNETKIFKEVWLEKKAYISKEGIRESNINLLKLSFINKKDDSFKVLNDSFKVLNANFEFVSFGFANDIFMIEMNNEDLIKKDTLVISFLYNNQRINKRFLRIK